MIHWSITEQLLSKIVYGIRGFIKFFELTVITGMDKDILLDFFFMYWFRLKN